MGEEKTVLSVTTRLRAIGMFDSVEEQVTIKVYMNHNFSVKRMKCRSGIEPPNYAGSVSAV